jgi:hypothetical protein
MKVSKFCTWCVHSLVQLVLRGCWPSQCRGVERFQTWHLKCLGCTRCCWHPAIQHRHMQTACAPCVLSGRVPSWSLWIQLLYACGCIASNHGTSGWTSCADTADMACHMSYMLGVRGVESITCCLWWTASPCVGWKATPAICALGVAFYVEASPGHCCQVKA